MESSPQQEGCPGGPKMAAVPVVQPPSGLQDDSVSCEQTSVTEPRIRSTEQGEGLIGVSAERPPPAAEFDPFDSGRD